MFEWPIWVKKKLTKKFRFSNVQNLKGQKTQHKML